MMRAAPDEDMRIFLSHADRRRGAPRRLLRPLLQRGRRARGRRPRRAPGGDQRAPQPRVRRAVRRDAQGRVDRLAVEPEDLETLVEAVTLYHMVIEGMLALTGQHFIIDYNEQRGHAAGLRRGLHQRRARRAPPRRLRRALPARHGARGPALRRGDPAHARRGRAGRRRRAEAEVGRPTTRPSSFRRPDRRDARVRAQALERRMKVIGLRRGRLSGRRPAVYSAALGASSGVVAGRRRCVAPRGARRRHCGELGRRSCRRGARVGDRLRRRGRDRRSCSRGGGDGRPSCRRGRRLVAVRACAAAGGRRLRHERRRAASRPAAWTGSVVAPVSTCVCPGLRPLVGLGGGPRRRAVVVVVVAAGGRRRVDRRLLGRLGVLRAARRARAARAAGAALDDGGGDGRLLRRRLGDRPGLGRRCWRRRRAPSRPRRRSRAPRRRGRRRPCAERAQAGRHQPAAAGGAGRAGDRADGGRPDAALPAPPAPPAAT